MRSKRVLKMALVVSIFIGVGCFFYLDQPDKESSKAWKNVEQIGLVKFGMDSTIVLEIMGQPLERRVEGGEIYFDYEVPSGWSGQCQIIFDSNGKVVYLSPSDHWRK